MNKAERTERLRQLSRIALGLARRNDRGYIIELPRGRFRHWDFRHNEIAVAYLKSLDPDVPSELTIRYLRAKVLHVEWTADDVEKTSFKPGDWEERLRHYDRINRKCSPKT